MGAIVDEAARRSPDKVALIDEGARYTFGELDRLSTAFAGRLIALGVEMGDRIAFCAPKSAALVVAMLGCLKAGAVYVPIDSKAPHSRIGFILENLRPRAVVSDPALYAATTAALAPKPALIEVARLGDAWAGAGGEAPPNLPRVGQEAVAYCLYTSGSTGRPKGVLIQHGAVAAFFQALAEVMPIQDDAICMNTSELYFDVHVMDLFFPLHRGASVHLSSGPLIASELLRTIEQERVTHFTAVGPVMTMLANADSFETRDLSSLRRIMTGAEIINVATIQRWLRRTPGLTIVNGYGPTEVTVICTAYLIDSIESDRADFYPIGKPMRDSHALLLDGDQEVSEAGETGELLIAGPQVMKGYWNDERQTAERIVQHAGRRYYRTGDLCRWRADGNLDFIGRADEEIKLSGFRISLNEIARVMNAAPGVQEGHPVVAVHPQLGKITVACFTRDLENRPEDIFVTLQSAIKHELPYYMVPSIYVLFENFPKLSSGKTDKHGIADRVNELLLQDDGGTTRFCLSPDVHA